MGTPSIETLKSTVLPELFNNSALLGEYGSSGGNASALDNFSNLMESGAVSNLATKIGEIVTKLADADPKIIQQKPNWIDRFLGRGVERQIKYQAARQELNKLIEDTQVIAQGVQELLVTISTMVDTHASEAESIRIYIKAAKEFLEENPQIGIAAPGEMTFERPRERLERKLANLVTLLSSHEMSVAQLKLTRAQAVDMIDRFNETTRVLIPVWRQHTLALITVNKINPAVMAEAVKAHQALMGSLTKSLEGIEQ